MFLGYRYARRKIQERRANRQVTELPSPTRNGSVPRRSEAAEGSDNLRPEAAAISSSILPTPEEKAESHRRQSYRWKIVIGLFAPFTLQALDTTIVAAALPTIAAEFSEFLPPPPKSPTTTSLYDVFTTFYFCC